MNIVAVTSMRNEGPNCLEWIAHHMAVGVGHFLIYSNDCDDGTDRMLDALARIGLVTHIPQKARNGKTVQWQALKDASAQPVVLSADWVLVTDCDEFINLRPPCATLQEMIVRLPDGVDAVAMPWRLFGNNGLVEADDTPTISRFTRAAPEDLALPLAHFFKSLFRPAAFRRIGVHRPKRKKGRIPVWVDGAGSRFPPAFGKMDNRINLYGTQTRRDLVQLNHYSLRSAQEFMVKRLRGLPNHSRREIGLGYWIERNFNSVEDDSILRLRAAMQEQLEALLTVQGLGDLLAQSREIHRMKFETLMADRDQIQMFWQLGLSAGSRPPSEGFARAQLQRLTRVQTGNG